MLSARKRFTLMATHLAGSKGVLVASKGRRNYIAPLERPRLPREAADKRLRVLRFLSKVRNVERQNVKRQNVEQQNVERQNVEQQNVD
jgi:hypothetical protein